MRLAVLAATASLALAGAAQASTSLITSAVGYTGPQLDLSAYANGSYNFTFGPLSLPGGITFTGAPGGGGNSGNGSVVGQGTYGLGTNGSFGGAAVYIGVDSATGYDDLRLASAVNTIGFFFNYCPNCGGNDATISTLDAGGNVVASFDLQSLAPISTPGGVNQFEFRGVASTATDIYGLRIGGNYILASGTATGALPGGVPEPASWALMILGFGGVGATLRRRRAVAA
ncbi:MAG TPA: PEPxxWA-CTERM sorting domain-containing protein [Phenylobacterium sp.]|nr:PEPxxWA-CTERM sorting domain-containing protein [Phenylobacterium sp.]